jgi:nucleoside-diphosphate-sugar epimerase
MNVFLTGSSGFLGGEFLVSLSKRKGISKIFCLIRANNQEEATERINKVFQFHGDFFDRDKVIAVPGDLLDPDLAQKLTQNAALKDIRLVLHAAANTSFSKHSDRMVEKVNIEGLRSILTWCQTLKELETFAYIGTATICGCAESNRIVYEDESPHPHTKHLVKYTYTKMMGELMLSQYLPKEKILVLRPSIVMGDTRPWIPRSPVILWALATMNLLRLVPVNPLSQIDIIPVDYAIEAMIMLLFAQRHYSVYHISSGTASATNTLKVTSYIESYFPDRPPFKFINSLAIKQIKKFARNPRMLSENCELLQYPEYLNYWSNSIAQNGQMRILFAGIEPYFKFIELGQVFDNSRLLEDTGISPAPPAHEYIKICLKYLDKIDVFECALDP